MDAIRQISVGRARGVRAFTLTELVVAVAIIAILAAMLVPVISNGINSAKKALCATHLRTTGNAIRHWAARSGGQIPFRNPGRSDESIYSIGTKKQPEGLGFLITAQYVPLETFKSPHKNEVSADNPVTDEQWNSPPGTPKVVHTHVLYRQLDRLSGREARGILADLKGTRVLVADLHCEDVDGVPYVSHPDETVHLLRASGTVTRHSGDEALILPDFEESSRDDFFDRADSR